MAIPSPKCLYRIIHIDNLEYILQFGKLTCPTHPEANPNYLGIGDSALKESRRGKQIEIDPFGTFSDYLAFYFGYRSPMLYNIKNGYQEVTKRNQEEIIYLVSSVEKVVELGLPFVFFDGHGYHNFSQPFNTLDGLSNIDWKIINAGQWYDTEEDPDRNRRKQAEFLIKHELPIEAILGIGVYNQNAKNQVQTLLDNNKVGMKSVVIPKWYY